MFVVTWCLSFVMLVGGASCSAPEYKFASADTGASNIADGGDSNSPTDGDAGGAVITEPPPPATPIQKIVIDADAGGDFGASCVALNNDGTLYAFQKNDVTSGKKHCYVYFAAKDYKRTWAESKDACLQITTLTPARTAHLATFSTGEEATSVQDAFKSGQVPWIGLELVNAAEPVNKDSWQWITSEPKIYDGWEIGSPRGALCASWAGNGRYNDVICFTQKGFLCEVDE